MTDHGLRTRNVKICTDNSTGYSPNKEILPWFGQKYTVSNREQFLIKSGLYLSVYGIHFQATPASAEQPQNIVAKFLFLRLSWLVPDTSP